MGALALNTLLDVLDEKKVSKEQLTPPKMITPDNVDNPALWGNKFKP